MSWKIFTGIEAEGPYKGTTSLFIEGIPPYEELAKQLLDQQYNSVYFGARYKQFKPPSQISHEYIFKLIKKGIPVVVDGALNEYDLVFFLNSKEFKNSVHARVIISMENGNDILTVHTADWPVNKIWIKIIDYDKQLLTLFPMQSLQIPDKSLYEKDELLVEGE